MSSSLLDTVAGLKGQPLVDLMMQLVRIASPSGQEAEIMEFAAHYLGTQGAEVKTLGRKPDRPNVVATIGTGGPPLVVLNGHLDTVKPAAREQWESDPLQPVLRDGRVVGLGALDMKGSCAAFMLAFRALKERVRDLHGTVQLQLVCDEEESGYYGTPYLVEVMKTGGLPRPDHVIIGEKTGLMPMIAERGTLKFWVHFSGRSTHTATSRVEGRNAIYAAAEAVRVLERDLDIEHPAVGKAVISVNQIKGGAHPSQVPDSCTIQVDRRLVPGETMESALDQARGLIETLRDQIPWLAFEVTPCLDDSGAPRYSPPNLTPADAPVVEAVRKAHRAVTGLATKDYVGWYGSTDGRCFRIEGIDCVVYGPIGAHAHGPNEYVILETLETQLEVVARAVANLCGAL